MIGHGGLFHLDVLAMIVEEMGRDKAPGGLV